MSAAALDWVAALDTHLRGAARALLWALANHANKAGETWPSERTMAREAGVSYAQVRALLPALVELGVLDKLKPRAGTRAAVYRFTFRDAAGLPKWLASAPVSGALSEASLVRQDPALVRQDPASSAPVSGAKPLEPENHPLQVGGSGSPESDARSLAVNGSRASEPGPSPDPERGRVVAWLQAQGATLDAGGWWRCPFWLGAFPPDAPVGLGDVVDAIRLYGNTLPGSPPAAVTTSPEQGAGS